ncbi:hypothetical protein ACIO14_00075 [Nocardia fluminea]|uniref:hypothetical protein n=1 Tax=Nocardia fluminea TaxID=134984 RepID=UPI003812F21F
MDRRLTELFVALCADMPTHRRYVTDIVWTIAGTGSAGFVQGVFSTKADTCYLDRRDDSGEQIFNQTFPLTSAGGVGRSGYEHGAFARNRLEPRRIGGEPSLGAERVGL